MKVCVKLPTLNGAKWPSTSETHAGTGIPSAAEMSACAWKERAISARPI